nr:serine/threonine-protein kinase Nek10-like [Nerophis lumbriciformis]
MEEKGRKCPGKSKKSDAERNKPTEIHTVPSCDLWRLQALLAMSGPEQEVLSHSKTGSSRFHSPHGQRDSCSEASELERFSMTYREQRCFSSHPLHKVFSNILASLVKNNLCSDWIDVAPPESVLRVLLCLRLLIRDPQHQKVLHRLQGVSSLAKHMSCVADMYLACDEQEQAARSLVAMTYMFQKLSAAEDQRVWVIESGAHTTLVKLLSTTDSSVLLGALIALTSLAESAQCRDEIGELQIVENLLVILQEYDLLSKRMAAELLRRLSPVQRVRDQLRELEGLPVLLSLLHTPHLKLLWSVAWTLVQLCQDPDARADIRSWGGVQPLLRLLGSQRRLACDRLSVERLSSANAADRVHKGLHREEVGPQDEANDTVALQSGHTIHNNTIFEPDCCGLAGTPVGKAQPTFWTAQFVEDLKARFVRSQPTAGLDLLPPPRPPVPALRLARPSPPLLFPARPPEDELETLRESIRAVDQNRPALKVINSYAILDHLGTGAFGSVFKVRKQSGQNLLALKEVNLRNPAFGKEKKSRDSNVEKIILELAIIKEQMAHPNVVKYYKTFLEDDKLYIVMELIEGVPLLERCNSLKEKQQHFTEDQIWNIFIQMCLALRYLHKEKRIVHRDLTPNNIMLGEKDKVTITDFGLAKQKQESCKLTSVVGTILYSCPEVVKNEPYGEKADIWALGCIAYQMATLEPPFYSTNMLSLANKIVEAIYKPLEEGAYSDRLEDMIVWCLSSDADQRPDIVVVSSRISDLMMRLMDGLYTSQSALERRAERHRTQAQKYFLDKHRSRESLSLSVLPEEQDFMTAELPIVYFPASPNQTENHLSLGQVSEEDVETLMTRNSPKEHYSQSSVLMNVLDESVSRSSQLKFTLFQSGSDARRLKVELGKLMQASSEPVDSGCGSPFRRVPGHVHPQEDSGDSLGGGVTYQHMQGIVEELLEDNGYYEATRSREADVRSRPYSSP